jgi:GDSL-like Lipase/Acylhydrolase family
VSDVLIYLLAILWVALGGGPTTTTAAPQGGGFHSEPEAEVGVPAPAGGGPGSLLVVGDSLAVGASPHLAGALPGWRIEEVTRTGMPTAEGVAALTQRSGGQDVIAVSLGTNDDPSAVDTFQGQVETVLDAAGPRCVVWANIVRPPYNGVSYSGYNRVLSRLAAARPNLQVVDWAGIVAADPSLLADDGVHANTAGYAARGQAYAQAVQGCGG